MEQNINQMQTAKTHPLAFVSLALSLAGFTVLPLIGSVAGIITGNMALREIASAPQQYRDEGIAKAGVILGWINVGLALLVLVALLAFLLVAMPLAR